MGGLSDLTTYAQDTFAYTDQRIVGPKFNLPFTPASTSFINTDTSFEALRFGLEIIEVVRPETADLQMLIDVSAFPTATVVWDTIPNGCVVTENAGLYTLTGIDSVEIWDQVKAPTITRPGDINYFQYGYYLGWSDGTQDQIIGWVVGSIIPDALLESSSTMVCSAERIRSTSKALSSSFTMIALALPDLYAVFSLSADVTKTRFGSANLTATTTIDKIDSVMNLTPQGYYSNQKTQIYLNDVPYIRFDTATTYELEFTVTDASIALSDTGTITNTLTISGTRSEVNAQLEDILLFPDYNFTGQVVMTVVYKEDDSVVDTFKTSIQHLGAGTGFTTQTFTYTSPGTVNKSFTYEEVQYGEFDALIVGGGGGGSHGGGGGGGQVIELSNLTIDYASSYAITVGGGGAPAPTPSNTLFDPWDVTGSPGGTSSAFGRSAFGGQGGKSSSDDGYGGTPTEWNFSGGNAGTPTGFTLVGGSTIDTSFSKLGTASYQGDRNNKGYLAANTPVIPSTGEFTMECWVNFDVIDLSTWIITQYDDSESGRMVLYTGGTNGEFRLFAGTTIFTGTTIPVINTWYHVAVVRDSSNEFRLYVNGVEEASATSSVAISTSENTRIGMGKGGGDVRYVDGHIDEVRISDTARYTTNFTPQTSEFTTDINTLRLLHMTADEFAAAYVGGAGAPIPTGTLSEAVFTGGGGAGAGGNGSNSHLASIDGSTYVYAGGDGGQGASSSITGTALKYGGGGGGSNGSFHPDFNTTDDFPDGGTQDSFPFVGGGHGWYGTENGAAEAGDDGYGGGGGGGAPTETYSLPKRGGSGTVIIKVSPK